MTKTELNFNDLPCELKRLIFDKNRQAAQDQRYRQNKGMMMMELESLCLDASDPVYLNWIPSEIANIHKSPSLYPNITLFADEDLATKIEIYFELADHDILPYKEKRQIRKRAKAKEAEATQLVHTHLQKDDVWEQCFN